jgi:hypothetical protein
VVEVGELRPGEACTLAERHADQRRPEDVTARLALREVEREREAAQDLRQADLSHGASLI